MSRVLAIEDDEVTAREIMAELTAHGFEVDWSADGREGLLKAASGDYDAITLDRMLPGMDGLSIISVLRGAGVETPVLMISALSDIDERVKGLRAGGDDYLTKPFASEEMTARLESLLRRRSRGAESSKLRVADLELDETARTAHRAGMDLRLLPTEFKLLGYMMRNAGQVLTRTMIFEAVWGYRYDPGTNLIDVHMARIRRKVDAAGLPPLVRTVRGSGYVLGPAD
jgi:two-component system OmpR family response regulator